MKSDSKNLLQRSFSAIRWGAIGAFGKIFLQFFTQIFLARLLGPTEYGLFAIGVLVVSLSNFLSDIGIAYGLIQKKEVSDSDVRFVFTWQIIIGIFISAAINLLAGSVAVMFGEPRAADVIGPLALVCLINAVTAPSMNLLKRRLDFKRLQTAQLAGYIIGYIVVGIPLAIVQPDVSSLVIAWITQAAASLVVMYRGARHPLKPLLWYAGGFSTVRYGLTVLATNLTNWSIQNIDRVIIGKIFTAREIGLYSTAYNLLYTPTATLLGILQPVFFSSSARMADQSTVQRGTYLTAQAVIALTLLPAYTMIAMRADDIIHVLYGDAWHAAAPLLVPLAFAMPLMLMWGMSTPVLWTTGNATSEFKSQLPLAFLWASAAWLASQISLAAVAWVAFLFSVMRTLIVMRQVCRILAIPTLVMWRAVLPGIVLSILIVSVEQISRITVHRVTESSIVLPIICTALSLIVCRLFLLKFRFNYCKEISSNLSSIASKMPHRIRIYINTRMVQKI
jgi:O-antigen/teichoic acid export membrane protein